MDNNSGLTYAVQAGPVLDRPDPFWPRIGLAQLRRRLALAPGISDAHLKVVAQVAAYSAASELAWRRHMLRMHGACPAGEQRFVAALWRCYLRRIEVGTRRALHRGVVVEARPAGTDVEV